MCIGWIGLGKMGVPMSRQLLKAGYSLTVHNRTREKEETLAGEGASRAESPADVLEQSDVVFLMVSDDEAVRQVFTSQNGLLSGTMADKVIVNMSTVSPDISREMQQQCVNQGGNYVDAPVSGSVPQAESQQLAIIAGGDEEAVEKVRPLLEQLGKTVRHVGDCGTGNATKLAVNTFLGVITEGLAEVLDFAEQLGVDRQDFMSILNSSSLGSPFIKMKGDAVLENNYEAAFTLAHLAKDLRLARQSGLDEPVANQVHDLLQDAEPELGGEDVIALIKRLAK